MKRIAYYFVSYAVLAGAVFILFTENGLNWVLRILEREFKEYFSFKCLKGSLIGPIEIQDITVCTPLVDIYISEIVIDWNAFELFAPVLNLSEVKVSDLKLVEKKDQNPEKEAFDDVMSKIKFPIPIIIKNLQINNIKWISLDGKSSFNLDAFNLKCRLNKDNQIGAIILLNAEWGEINLKGKAFLGIGIPVNVEADWKLFLPKFEKIIGKGNIQGTINLLNIDQEISPFNLKLIGSIKNLTAKPEFLVDARWKDFILPIDYKYKSSLGQFNLKGSVKNYDFKSKLNLSIPSLPEFKLDLTGHGNDSFVQISSFKGNLFEGIWDGSGKIAWLPYLYWDFLLNASKADTKKIWNKLSGTVSAQLKTKGDIKNNNISGKLKIEKLEGILRTYPLKAKGELSLNNGRYNLKDLHISSGSSKIYGNACLNDKIDAKLNIKAPDLSEFLPEIKGNISADGTIKGFLDRLNVDLNLKIDNVKAKDVAVKNLKADIKCDFAQKNGLFDLDLEAYKINIGKEKISKLILTGKGLTDNHKVSLSVKNSAKESLGLDISGKFKDGKWYGVLANGYLNIPSIGNFLQERSTEIYLTKNDIEILPWIWCENNTKISAEGKWNYQKKKEFSLSFKIKQFPAEKIKPYINIGNFKFYDSKIDADANINGNGKVLNTSIKVDIDKILKANCAVTFDDFNDLFKIKSDQRIKGQADLVLNDFSHISNIFPELKKVKGTIGSKLYLSGTLNNPVISGSIDLFNSSFYVVPLGININNITFNAKSYDSNTIKLKGALSSGIGKIELSGNSKLNNIHDWYLNLDISGKNFEALKIPEAWVFISPDLNVSVKQKKIEIQGEILVPEININPLKLGNTVNISQDVVILNKEVKKEKESFWDINSKVKIKFGKKVKVHAYGFQGLLSGEIDVIQLGEKIPTAQGQINILEGKYKDLGIEFVIDNGKLTFAGGPLNNPGVYIKALKKTTEKDIKIGVIVSGTLQNINIRLFSEPSMDNADILAYLLVGRPIHQASQNEGKLLYKAASTVGLAGAELLTERISKRFGIEELRIEAPDDDLQKTSLVFGTYIAPRLYVSYMVGLLEQVNNVLRIKYHLSDNLTLETEAGKANGVDLKYSVEY